MRHVRERDKMWNYSMERVRKKRTRDVKIQERGRDSGSEEGMEVEEIGDRKMSLLTHLWRPSS